MAGRVALTRWAGVHAVVPTVPVTSGTQCGVARPAILSTPAHLADTPFPARYNSRFHPRETAP
mgnify:CR=1 FL=1